MSLIGWLAIGAAGLIAGAVNTIAGGGTLVTFPTLLAVGMSPVTANITSSVGLISGYVGGSVGYRRELGGQGHRARALGLVAVVGGAFGAVVLLIAPAHAFRILVPYLVALSCVLLLAQPSLSRWVARRRVTPTPGTDAGITSWATVGVFIAAVYGSYFGAGLGVLLLGVLGIVFEEDLQRLNALKSLLSALVNVAGVIVFIVSGRVSWAAAATIFVGAYGGGLGGAAIARRLKPAILRYVVAALGFSVAIALAITS